MTTTTAPPSAPVEVRPGRARRRTSTSAPKAARIGAFVPALALLGVFFAGPLLWAVYSAFTNVALTGAAQVDFVGLDNFKQMVQDGQFWNSLLLTLVFVVGSAVIGQNTLGLLIALLLRGRSKTARAVVSGLVIAAWTVPETVAAFCWYSFLHPGGTLDGILGWVGLSQNWLYTTPMLAVILANVWRGTAFSMLVYQAALNDVPPELQAEYGDCIGECRGIRCAGAGSNMGRIVSRYIGNDQCQHRSPARSGQPAARCRGEMLSYGVDFLDGCTAAQQLGSDIAEIIKRYAGYRYRQKTGAAST